MPLFDPFSGYTGSCEFFVRIDTVAWHVIDNLMECRAMFDVLRAAPLIHDLVKIALKGGRLSAFYQYLMHGQQRYWTRAARYVRLPGKLLSNQHLAKEHCLYGRVQEPDRS